MADPRIRGYDEATDLDAVARIWREVGWIDDDDAKRDALGVFMAAGNVEVADLDGSPECAVHWSPGTIDHTGTSLGLCAITAVTTSLIGRKQGFASSMTARALRQGAEAGHAVAALGMFEQGFYDRFGFATSAYDTLYKFDPGRLMVDDVPYRTPVRVTTEMWAEMHSAMTSRLTSHGSVNLMPERLLEAEVGFDEKPFGLGYRDADGTLTHFVFGRMTGENGPFDVTWIAYRSIEQLRELLRLLRELGDQVRSASVFEPAHVQMQTLIREPFRDRQRTRSSANEAGGSAIAWWQMRILDLSVCVGALSVPGDGVEFNLRVTDPVERYLDDVSWRGVAGEYTVSLGATSTAEPGATAGLPTLETTVNAFSRLWFGVRSPSRLLATDDLAAPASLIEALDRSLTIPVPHSGWMF